MSDRELRDELMTLLVAGHETTATGLSWAVELLARHPAELDRLETEVAAGERRLPRRRDQGDAAAAPRDRARAAQAGGADGDRRPPAARRGLGGALDLPGPPPPRHLSRARALPARAFHRAAGRHLHLDSVRRRGPALSRRCLRGVRDGGRPAGAGRPPPAAQPVGEPEHSGEEHDHQRPEPGGGGAGGADGERRRAA